MTLWLNWGAGGQHGPRKVSIVSRRGAKSTVTVPVAQLTALRAILGVGRLDLLTDDEPVILAVGHHVGEGAVAHDAHAAVDRDDLAVDVLDLVAHQERRHVGALLGAADAAQRIARLVRVVAFGAERIVLQRVEPRPRALGREGAGRDRVETNSVAAPFDGE